DAADRFFEHADDREAGTVHEHLLAEGVVEAGKESFGYVLADDHDVFTVGIFGFGEEAAALHGLAGIHFGIIRKSAAKFAALHFIILVADVVRFFPVVNGDGHGLYGGTKLRDG